MQATAATAAAFVPDMDLGRQKPLLRRLVERFRAARMEAEMALIDPRLREDAGLAPGSASGWPENPAG